MKLELVDHINIKEETMSVLVDEEMGLGNMVQLVQAYQPSMQKELQTYL